MSTEHQLPELKKWTRLNIKPEDYYFLPLKDSPKHILSAVWHWEVDRELGSRKGPFLANKKCMLWRSQQCAREPMSSPALRVRSVREVVSELKTTKIGHIPDPHDECFWDYNQPLISQIDQIPDPLNGGNLPSGNDFVKIYAVEIDWTRPQADIRREFSKWLANEGPAGKEGGKKAQYFRLLTNLGLRRLMIAGIRYNDALPESFPTPVRFDKQGRQMQAFFASREKGRFPRRNHARKKQAETSIQDRWNSLVQAVKSFKAEHISTPNSPKGMLIRSPGS